MEQAQGLSHDQASAYQRPPSVSSRQYHGPSSWSNTCNQYFTSTRIIALAIIAIVMLFFNLVFLFVNDHPIRNQTINSPAQFQIHTSTKIQNINTGTTAPLLKSPPLAGRFPKIFWIYTENEFDTEQINEQIYLYYFNQTAKSFGYEVRLANSWNSYDWLSQKTIARITKAMQNSKVDQTIHNVLKLSLLMENGGIIINQVDTIFLGEGFNWIEEMFNGNSSDYQQKFECQPSKSYLFLASVPDSTYGTRYIDPIIAAVPNSLILKEAFDLTIDFIMHGDFPYNFDFGFIKRNQDTGVNYLINSLEESINMAVYRYKRNVSGKSSVCQKFGIQSRKVNNMVTLPEFSDSQKNKLITTWDPEKQAAEMMNLKEVRLIRGMNSGAIPRILSQLIDNVVNNQNHNIVQYSPGSILFRILHAPGNKQVFLDPLPQREIQLCVIINKQLSRPEIDKSITHLLVRQTYKKWKQIIFTQNNRLVPKVEDQRIIFVNSSSNQVRNIEIAVTKFCQKQSYVVLINPGQKFKSLNALSEIARATMPRDVVGAFITLDEQGKILTPRQDLGRFHRGRQAIVNPNIHLLESIINHMRIFSVESFRYIPQFDLRDIHGKYFEDRLIFLMTLLEMIRSEIRQTRYYYLIKRFSSVWNVPRRAIFINSNIKISTLQWEQVNRQQLRRTRARLECEEVMESLHNTVEWKIPFSKMLAFNNGDEFTPVQEMKGEELIPKVIHQVWLGTKQMPPAKKYFYRKTKMIYPNFEVKLWREENITKQNFPLTYELQMNLLAFNKHSPYNKLATVTDILRHELLYHQGGFWKDAGMNMLRPIFDKLTKYKVVLAVDKTFRYRWLQGMCFFANAPKVDNMWRITNYRNTNRMRIYHSYASGIAGPIDFRQFVIGQEEYDPQILCMPYETFYPAQVTEHPEKDLCTKRLQELKEGDEYEINQNGWYLLSNCSELYPYSYGVEHNRFGDSWARRRDI